MTSNIFNEIITISNFFIKMDATAEIVMQHPHLYGVETHKAITFATLVDFTSSSIT